MRWIYGLLILLIFVAAACESRADAEKPLLDPEIIGNPALGQEIFTTPHGDAPPCSMCHQVDGSGGSFGPALDGVASRAVSRVPGMDGVDYLRQAILEPGAFDAAPETSIHMYEGFGAALTPEEVNHLIAYLLTLR